MKAGRTWGGGTWHARSWMYPEDDRAACSAKTALVEIVDAEKVPVPYRCKRQGCAQHWFGFDQQAELEEKKVLS